MVMVSHELLHVVHEHQGDGEGNLAIGALFSLALGTLTAYIYSIGMECGIRAGAKTGLLVWTLFDLLPALVLRVQAGVPVDAFHHAWSMVELTVVGIFMAAFFHEWGFDRKYRTHHQQKRLHDQPASAVG